MTNTTQLRNRNLGLKDGGRFAAATKSPDAVSLTTPVWAGQVMISGDTLRGSVTPEMIDREVVSRQNDREIRDLTAVEIARILGEYDRPNLVLLGRTGQGDKEAIYAELRQLDLHSWLESDQHRLRVRAMMSWVKNGGDNG